MVFSNIFRFGMCVCAWVGAKTFFFCVGSMFEVSQGKSAMDPPLMINHGPFTSIIFPCFNMICDNDITLYH